MDRSLVDKSLVGEQAHRVIETGDVRGRIDQIIPLTDVTDRGSFPIVRLLGIKIRRHDDGWFADDGQHIRAEFHHKQPLNLVAELSVGFLPAAHIEKHPPVIIHQNGWVKHKPILRL